jgi:hypothetical protein
MGIEMVPADEIRKRLHQETSRNSRRRWMAQAKALPQEQRQKVLDLIHGGATIGDASRAACYPMEITMAIIDMNMQVVRFLRKESV